MISGERKSRAGVLVVLVFALAAGARTSRAAVADPPPAGSKLGRLEQESVNDALVDLAIQVDAHADSKTIRAIHVVNQEVFSRRDWWFRWFNIFHRTTRGDIIERELLVRAGQPYDARWSRRACATCRRRRWSRWAVSLSGARAVERS
jgi:hypothetical protein